MDINQQNIHSEIGTQLIDTAHANHVARLAERQATLTAAIEQLYDTFRGFLPERSLDFLTAKGTDFLEHPHPYMPRLLQAFAEGEEVLEDADICALAQESLYSTLSTDWDGVFPAMEYEALENYGAAWLRHRLAHFPWEQGHQGALKAVVTLVNVGFDPEPLLRAWLEENTAEATLTFIHDWSAAYFYSGKLWDSGLYSPRHIDQFHQWIRNAAVRDIFFERMVELDPALVSEYKVKGPHFAFFDPFTHPYELVSTCLATNADLAGIED
ncbi:MAG: hypothetical protein Q4C87_09455 [Actinomycetaceae bacterium]|nr:hypothetical protein [Actinomycetaceae bacterium]